MGGKPKILAFAGSLRADSYNKKLIKVAAVVEIVKILGQTLFQSGE